VKGEGGDTAIRSVTKCGLTWLVVALIDTDSSSRLPLGIMHPRFYTLFVSKTLYRPTHRAVCFHGCWSPCLERHAGRDDVSTVTDDLLSAS